MHATSARGCITTTRIRRRRNTRTKQLLSRFAYTCVRTSERSDDEYSHSRGRTRQALPSRVAGGRWAPPFAGSVPAFAHRVAAPEKRRDLLGAERRVLGSERGGGARADREERGGKDDAAEDLVTHYEAHGGLGGDSWARRVAAGSGDWVPSRVDGTRKHVFEWRHSGDGQSGDRAQI